MAKEEQDKPVLGSKTETSYSTTRHSSTIGFDVGKELDAEIKQDPAYRSEPLLRLDQRDQKQNTNLAEPVRATLKCGQCGHRFLYKKDEPWCDQCGGEAFSDAALIQRGDLDDVVRNHRAWIRVVARKRWDRLNPPRKLVSSKGVQEELQRHAVDLNPPRPEETVTFEDFVGEVLAGLAEAIERYRPAVSDVNTATLRSFAELAPVAARRNGLNAFVREYVRGALRKVAADWRNRAGLKMESRLQQLIRGNPYAPPDRIRELYAERWRVKDPAKLPSNERIEHERALAAAV